MPLPPLEELLRAEGMTYDEIVATLLAAGYSPFYARHYAAFCTGRSDGDVVRRPKPKRPRSSTPPAR